MMLLARASHADIVYSDTTFSNTNWGLDVFSTGAAGGSATAGQVATGNPGTARSHLITSGPVGSTVHAFSRYGTTQSVGRYDPATQGEIVEVAFEMEFMFLSGTGPEQEQSVTVALKQGANVFAVPWTHVLTGTQGGAWLSLFSGALVQDDFVNASGGSPLHPDFSSSGATIRFGWMSRLNAVSAGPSMSEVAFDNWSVSIVQVPSPGAAGVIGAGLFAAARRRRS
jgi:MYXO-CTERM domain-containing protein